MPALKGESLESRLEREGRLRITEACRIACETAQGLHAAHEAGLIHRDIKPSNVWLEAERGKVKILDFGLACAAERDDRLTQSGTVLGTPAYMAPEQASGAAVDRRCDLFSLGCILYQMTTGQRPFRGATMMAVLYCLANERPIPPCQLNAEVPPLLSDVIE